MSDLLKHTDLKTGMIIESRKPTSDRCTCWLICEVGVIDTHIIELKLMLTNPQGERMKVSFIGMRWLDGTVLDDSGGEIEMRRIPPPQEVLQ